MELGLDQIAAEKAMESTLFDIAPKGIEYWRNCTPLNTMRFNIDPLTGFPILPPLNKLEDLGGGWYKMKVQAP